MYMNDLRDHIKGEIEQNKISIGGLSSAEQELILTDCRLDEVIDVHCSNQNYFLKLLRSDYFTLTGVLLSNHPKTEGYVLSIDGKLERKGLTLRQKKPVFSEEEKQLRAERMRKLQQDWREE